MTTLPFPGISLPLLSRQPVSRMKPIQLRSAIVAEQEQRVIEAHPFFHDWYRQEDEVVARNSRNRCVEVKRKRYCSACPTIKVIRFDTTVWENWRYIGKPYYVYVKGTQIIRIEWSTFIKNEFLATTNLPLSEFGVKGLD
jgi:hypothetical protein